MKSIWSSGRISKWFYEEEKLFTKVKSRKMSIRVQPPILVYKRKHNFLISMNMQLQPRTTCRLWPLSSLISGVFKRRVWAHLSTPDTPPFPTWSSANLRSAAMGSPPGDRTKSSGAQQLLSPNALGRSNGGGSMNFLPIFSVTNSCTAGITWAEERNTVRSIVVHRQLCCIAL